MRNKEDIRAELSVPLSQFNLHEAVSSVSNNPKELELIYQLIRDNDIKVAWKAAWVLEKIAKRFPELVVSYQNDLYTTVMKTNHDGLKRILLSTIYVLPGPKKIPVDFLDFCLERMLSFDESIANQALCIKHAFRLCSIEPELLDELQLYLENADREYYAKGVQSTIKNTLILINKQRAKQNRKK